MLFAQKQVWNFYHVLITFLYMYTYNITEKNAAHMCNLTCICSHSYIYYWQNCFGVYNNIITVEPLCKGHFGISNFRF